MLRTIKYFGLGLFLIGLVVFTAVNFVGEYTVAPQKFEDWVSSKGIVSELFLQEAREQIVGNAFTSFELTSKLSELAEKSHQFHVDRIREWESEGQVSQDSINAEWSKVIWLDWSKTHKEFTYPLLQKTVGGAVADHKLLFLFLTFGLGILGGLLYILPDVVLLGPAGIKHHGIYHNSATNRGWVGISVFAYLIVFYCTLYFFPAYMVNSIIITDPVSLSLSGNSASQWFMYGFMYCVVMTVMAVRMYVKYRNNTYQIFRTTVVLFFQIAFAFLIPELLVKFNQPWYDFKNAWPLDYDFFFGWQLDQLMASGNLGWFMLIWGVVLSLIIVPVMVYFFGKRWYCSWVCGCGGLAETLGDPYRQHSDKSVKAWKIERYLIHGVLGFAVVMTIMTLIVRSTGDQYVFGLENYKVQSWYGFFIGSIFSGVIGTGFYPLMGNRVWCRFGCPLAAYMGLVQRFKSKFRIATNGGQCISCGNCSTYCEQGIDVRSYAQKGQNIVRASCVGCGVCSAVCPRGVLKLENAPNTGGSRMEAPEVVLGNDGLKSLLKK